MIDVVMCINHRNSIRNGHNLYKYTVKNLQKVSIKRPSKQGANIFVISWIFRYLEINMLPNIKRIFFI